MIDMATERRGEDRDPHSSEAGPVNQALYFGVMTHYLPLTKEQKQNIVLFMFQ